jgi:hypothetical protein
VEDHNAKFRLDRRLQQRRGWIAPEQLERELSGLPDVAEKGEVVDSPQNKAPETPSAEGDGE